MARETKRRFVITAGGLDREVFSAFERPNGDLLLSMLPLTYHPDGTRTKYERYSVHRSLNSYPPICTIKHTLGLEDGRDITTAQVGCREHKPFQALLFTRVGPSFEPDRYIARPRVGDEIVRLHPAETVPFTVVLAVAVAAKDGSQNLFDGIGLTVTTSKFTHFNLQMALGFIPIPPFEEGVFGHTMTSAPRESGIPLFELPNASIECLTVSKIREHAARSMAIGADYIRNKLFDGDRFKLAESYSPEELILIKKGFNHLLQNPVDPNYAEN